MFNLKSGDMSYVVPIDEVDFELLKTSAQTGDNLKPLWSPRQNEYEYVEFHVKASKIFIVNDDDELAENNNTTMCHTCDTRVPTVYLNEHNNSKKHTMILKIIDETLTRLRNNININILTPSPGEPTKSTYFCEACSLSVLISSKDRHEASLKHNNSKKYDEILENFVRVFEKDSTNSNNDKDTNVDGRPSSTTKPFYFVGSRKDGKNASNPTKAAGDTNKDVINITAPNSNKPGRSKKNINYFFNAPSTSKDEQNNFSTTNSNNNVETGVNRNLSIETNAYKDVDLLKEKSVEVSNVLETDIEKKSNSTNSDESAERIDESSNSRDTNEDSKDTNDESNSAQNNEELILMNPLDKAKEYIRALSYILTTDAMKLSVLNEEYILISMRKKFKVRLDDFHGLIEIDGSLQCSLCNTVVTAKNDHIWAGHHMRWLIYHLPDDNCIRKINQHYFHCIICNHMVKNIDKHNLDISHVNRLKGALYTRGSPKKSANDSIGKKFIHYLIVPIDFNDTEVLCILCNRVIPANKFNIEGHLNGKSHKKVYNELLATNCINRVKDGFTCDFCRQYLPDKTEVDHALSEYHKVYKNGSIKFSTEHMYCEPCRIFIDINNFDGHILGRKHRQNASRKPSSNAKNDSVNINKANATVTNQDTNLNKVVTIDVQAEVSPKLENASSSVNKSKSVSMSKNCPSKKQTAESSASSNAKSLAKEIKSSNTQTKSDLKNISLKTNVQVANNSRESTSGTNNNEATSEINNNTIQPLMSTSNIKTKAQEPKVHYHLKKTENPKQLICRVCDVPVPNTEDNIASHTAGYNHNNNYKELLDKNNVVEVELNFRCKKCNVLVTSRNELDHIFGNKHKNAFCDDNSIFSNSEGSKHTVSSNPLSTDKFVEYFTKMYLFDKINITRELKCKVCQITIVDTMSSVTDHTKGSNHLNNYNSLLQEHLILHTKNGFVCSVCDEIIPRETELHHILSNDHKARLLKSLRDDDDDVEYDYDYDVDDNDDFEYDYDYDGDDNDDDDDDDYIDVVD